MNNWNQTQVDILNYIKEQTSQFKGAEKQEYTANYLAGKLNISRNSASQYLNEFAKEGRLLKINSRPVYFFHKEVLEELYQITFSETAFLSLSELERYLEAHSGKKKNFEKAIGYDTSLNYEISQCRMAMEYPPGGLPMLLEGKSGTGKSLLAKLSYEYAADKKLIQRETCQFFVFQCQSYVGKMSEAKVTLFGIDEKSGLLEQQTNNLIYI